MENSVTLSDDIMELIFFKLPSSSLMRFKSVSSAWKHLISDPRFVHQHYTKKCIAKRESINPSTTFLVYTHQYRPTPDNYFTRVSISCTGRKLNHKHKLEDMFWLPFFACDPQLLGSGAGLVYSAGFGIYCLFQFCDGNKKLALWNPGIRELTELPWPCLHSEYSGSYDYGFGHVEYEDDVFTYKVGLMHVRYDLDKDAFCLSIELYSSTEKSWKLFKDSYCGQEKYLNGKWQHSGTNLNGKFYFLPWFSGEVRRIVTFDMTTHKFGSVNVPPSCVLEEDPRYCFPDLALTKLDEKSLCLLVYNKGNVNEAYSLLEAWVYMEQDESWILKSSACPIINLMEVSVLRISSCLGGVLLKDGERVTYCRYGSAQLETLPVESNKYEFNKMMEYEESIVSFNGGAWDRQQIIRR